MDYGLVGGVAFASEGCSGIFCREEIEGADGGVAKLLRLLEVPAVRVATTNTTAVPVLFWDAGPSATDLQAWHDAECDTCAPPTGFDEVDGTVDRLQEFVDLSKSLKAQPIDDVAKSWQSWLTVLIDTTPGRTDDFDDTLKAIAQGASTEQPPVKGIPGWSSELIDIRDTKIPLCAITSPHSAEVTIDNSPCTINQARKDEFNREFANSRAFLAELTNPRSQFNKNLINTRVLPHLTEPLLETYTDVQNLTVSLNEPSMAMVDGNLSFIFTYTFEYWNDCGADCPPPTWVSASQTGEGTVKITSLKLGGGPTDGTITYDFTYGLSYQVPHPTPEYDGGGGDPPCDTYIPCGPGDCGLGFDDGCGGTQFCWDSSCDESDQ